jgi:hypothetical protein
MTRPRQHREPVIRFLQEMAAMRPSLLESPREGRDVGPRFGRGVRDWQGRDELLVS